MAPRPAAMDSAAGREALSENMKLRVALLRDLQTQIEARGWKQAEAAEMFHVALLRISDLLRRRFSLFSLDTLINMSPLKACILICGLGKLLQVRLLDAIPQSMP
jgi:predicted XRE-type DNA-binding protein